MHSGDDPAFKGRDSQHPPFPRPGSTKRQVRTHSSPSPPSAGTSLPHPNELAPVADALRLRRWALEALTSRPSPPPSASAEGWQLFLGREACARRLSERVGALAPAPLAEAALGETQVILLLRAELEEVVQVAREIGVAPIVLKGGTALHSDDIALWAKDIDLLLAGGDAERLAAALDARGWRPHEGASPNHLAARLRPGRPPIEIHVAGGRPGTPLSASAEQQAVPHPRLTGARLLHPEDHLRHVATHQAIEHSAYRGRLRDLLLLAAASPAQDPDARWGLRSGQARAVGRVLTMADALHRGAPCDDPFEELAGIWYLMARAQGPAAAGKLARTTAIWVYTFVAGDGAAGDHWRVVWGPRNEARSNLPLVGAVGGVAPTVGTWLRALLRILWLPPVILVGWIRAARLRRRLAPLLRQAHQGT